MHQRQEGARTWVVILRDARKCSRRWFSASADLFGDARFCTPIGAEGCLSRRRCHYYFWEITGRTGASSCRCGNRINEPAAVAEAPATPERFGSSIAIVYQFHSNGGGAQSLTVYSEIFHKYNNASKCIQLFIH